MRKQRQFDTNIMHDVTTIQCLQPFIVLTNFFNYLFARWKFGSLVQEPGAILDAWAHQQPHVAESKISVPPP